MARTYTVTIPIAGHVAVTVQAENEKDAISLACDIADQGEVEWESLDRFHQGNVCYCPPPWEIEVVEEQEDEG